MRIWKDFVKVFNSLPFGALIQERIFCVPSGLSPQLTRPEDLLTIQRPVDVPEAWQENSKGVNPARKASVEHIKIYVSN